MNGGKLTLRFSIATLAFKVERLHAVVRIKWSRSDVQARSQPPLRIRALGAHDSQERCAFARHSIGMSAGPWLCQRSFLHA